MPTTRSRSPRAGSPCRAACSACAARTAEPMATSASAVTVDTTSSRLASPARSRWMRVSMTRARSSRSAEPSAAASDSGMAATAASRSARVSAAAPLAARACASDGRAPAIRLAKGESRRVRSKAAGNESGELRSIITRGPSAPAATIARNPARAHVAAARDPHFSRTASRPSPAPSRASRRSWPAAAVFVFLAAVLALRYVVFPQIDNYREDISASLSAASGMAVSIQDVDAGWYGLRPTLILTGVRVADKQGNPVLGLERVEATLSWWTLFAGDLRFHDVDLYSPQLSLRRGADGLIYLADKPLNAGAAGEDGALAAWLLDQPRLAIHDATLAWQDELAGAPEIRLRKVEIAIRKEGRRHRAALNAMPPAAIAGRLDLRADLLLSREGRAMGGLGDALRRGRARRPRAPARAPAGSRDAARGRGRLPGLGGLRAGAGARGDGRPEPARRARAARRRRAAPRPRVALRPRLLPPAGGRLRRGHERARLPDARGTRRAGGGLLAVRRAGGRASRAGARSAPTGSTSRSPRPCSTTCRCRPRPRRRPTASRRAGASSTPRSCGRARRSRRRAPSASSRGSRTSR